MGDLVNIGDYKVKDTVGDVIKNIVGNLYTICLSNLKIFDVYSYIDVDILELIESEVLKLDITDNLKNDICTYADKLGGVYSYLNSLQCIGDYGISSIDILYTLIEDGVSERFIADGFKVCLKLEDEDICILDEDNLIELSNNNVFDRIIVKVLDSIPYELIYIR